MIFHKLSNLYLLERHWYSTPMVFLAFLLFLLVHFDETEGHHSEDQGAYDKVFSSFLFVTVFYLLRMLQFVCSQGLGIFLSLYCRWNQIFFCFFVIFYRERVRNRRLVFRWVRRCFFLLLERMLYLVAYQVKDKVEDSCSKAFFLFFILLTFLLNVFGLLNMGIVIILCWMEFFALAPWGSTVKIRLVLSIFGVKLFIDIVRVVGISST